MASFISTGGVSVPRSFNDAIRLLVGLILPSLCSLEEFNSCLAEVVLGILLRQTWVSFQVVVVLPHSCVGQILQAVDRFLCEVQEFEEDAECMVEGEILMVEEELTIHKADELLPDTVVDTESVNGEQVLGLEVGGCDNEGAPSDPNCDLMRQVKVEIGESSADQKDPPMMHLVKNQANSTHVKNQANPTHSPNSTGKVEARLQQSSQKGHRCTTCGKGFVSRSNMRAHMRLHEGTALR